MRRRRRPILASDVVLGEVFAPGIRNNLPIQTRTLPVALGVFVDALFAEEGALALLLEYMDGHHAKSHRRVCQPGAECHTCQDAGKLVEVLRLLKRTL
jgi:hypothetical protein